MVYSNFHKFRYPAGCTIYNKCGGGGRGVILFERQGDIWGPFDSEGICTNCKGKVASRNMSISPTLFIYSRIVVMSGMGGFYFLFFGFEALNAQKSFWGEMGWRRELHFEKSSVRSQYK